VTSSSIELEVATQVNKDIS